MSQRTWSTTEVSAYLDGQLEPKRQAALETDMAHNATLRRRVEDMQQVVSLLRAEPLREPPRNYLLTASMVAEASPRATASSRRTPLFVLRLATSMVSLAFVITFGLTALQGNLSPGMRAGSSDAPEAAMMAQEAEAVEDNAYEAAPEDAESESRVMMVPGEPEQQEDVQVESAPEEPAPAPLLGAADDENDAETATGGESPEPEMSAMAAEAPAAEGTALPPEGDALEEGSAPDPADLQRAIVPDEDAADEEKAALRAQASGESEHEETLSSEFDGVATVQEPDTEGPRTTTLSPWIPRGLGISAAILAAVTLWVTHHPLSRRK